MDVSTQGRTGERVKGRKGEEKKSPTPPLPLAPSRSVLAQRVAAELGQAPRPGIDAFCQAVRARHGEAVAAVLFYGSCLRKDTLEGVLDFYVLVDSYKETYRRRLPAFFNRLIPPNVFYLEWEAGDRTLHAKYAVISVRDFERGMRPRCLHAYIWARFAQPSLLAYARDEQIRNRAVHAAARAVVTLVQRLSVFQPYHDGALHFTASALWHEAFRRTYGAELRTETAETVQTVYEAAPARYDAAAAEALAVLHAEGWLDALTQNDDTFAATLPASRLRRARRAWYWRRPVAKAIAFFRLLKTAFTFGDWVPYAKFKLERHTGTKIELTPRQRRYPLLFFSPVILRLFLRGDIR